MKRLEFPTPIECYLIQGEITKYSYVLGTQP
jgi:hypothetical protein